MAIGHNPKFELSLWGNPVMTHWPPLTLQPHDHLSPTINDHTIVNHSLHIHLHLLEFMARGMQSIQDIDRTYYRLVWRCWEKCWPVQKQHVFHQAMGRAQLRYKIESHLCWAQNLPWTTCQIQCVSFQNSHLQTAPHILILHQCHYFVWNHLPVKGNKSLTMWHSRARRSILSSIETIKTELVLRY